jgi:hypothetical protein
MIYFHSDTISINLKLLLKQFVQPIISISSKPSPLESPDPSGARMFIATWATCWIVKGANTRGPAGCARRSKKAITNIFWVKSHPCYHQAH